MKKKKERLLGQAGDAVKLTPDTQDDEIHAEDEVRKVRKDSTDIMKDSRSSRKCDPSRISLVKMSLGLMFPGM